MQAHFMRCPDDPSTERSRRLRWPGRTCRPQPSAGPAVPLVVAVGVLVLMTNFLVPTLVGVYVDRFGLSMREAGYTAAVYMLGGGLGALCVSAALFSVRTRVLLVVGLCALAVGNLAGLYTRSFGMILAVRLLAGVGEGIGFALMAAGVSRMRNPRPRLRHLRIYVVAADRKFNPPPRSIRNRTFFHAVACAFRWWEHVVRRP